MSAIHLSKGAVTLAAGVFFMGRLALSPIYVSFPWLIMVVNQNTDVPV